MTLVKKPNNLKSLVGSGPIAAIFAHPDDEAFGPAGTLAQLSIDYETYVICATYGEAGEGQHSNLAEVRAEELKVSAKILGIKKVYFLGFKDGTLSNSLYHKLAEKIERILKKLKPSTIITFEPRGISGHIDHITISMVSSFVFERSPHVKTLLQHCIRQDIRKKMGDYFIYFPAGYKKSDIDLTVNVKNQWGTKIKAMMAHKSQAADAKRVLKMRQGLPKEEYFLITQK